MSYWETSPKEKKCALARREEGERAQQVEEREDTGGKVGIGIPYARGGASVVGEAAAAAAAEKLKLSARTGCTPASQSVEPLAGRASSSSLSRAARDQLHCYCTCCRCSSHCRLLAFFMTLDASEFDESASFGSSSSSSLVFFFYLARVSRTPTKSEVTCSSAQSSENNNK